MALSKTNHSQGRLYQQRLSDQLDPHNRLLILSGMIDWEEIENDFSKYSPAKGGRKGKPARLMAGLFLLQSMFDMSDQDIVEYWCQNPYWQLFCGFDYLQWEFPIHPSSLSRWRKRVGEKGLEKLLTATIHLAVKTRTVRPSSFKRVIVDTTVMPKNIAFPTDSALYYRGINLLRIQAQRHGLKLRQSYKRVSYKTLMQARRYARAAQMRRASKETKRLKTYLGRLRRDIEGKGEIDDFPFSFRLLLKAVDRLLEQARSSKNKVYSLHEPDAVCICKGKSHRRYEFGAKVSIVLTHREGLAMSMQSLKGNPFDGHTLKGAIEHAQRISGQPIAQAFVDRGYKGHNVTEQAVYISGQKKGVTPALKRAIKRRSAIEPHIGHMKSEGRLSRNYLKGELGDVLNTLLVAIGHNLRLIMREMCTT